MIGKFIGTVFPKIHLDFIYKYVVSLLFVVEIIAHPIVHVFYKPSTIIQTIMLFFDSNLEIKSFFNIKLNGRNSNLLTLAENNNVTFWVALIITIVSLISLYNKNSQSNRSHASLQLSTLLFIESGNEIFFWLYFGISLASLIALLIVVGLFRNIDNPEWLDNLQNNYIQYFLGMFGQLLFCFTPIFWLFSTSINKHKKCDKGDPIYTKSDYDSFEIATGAKVVKND
jgi:hypothetical protein